MTPIVSLFIVFIFRSLLPLALPCQSGGGGGGGGGWWDLVGIFPLCDRRGESGARLLLKKRGSDTPGVLISPSATPLAVSLRSRKKSLLRKISFFLFFSTFFLGEGKLIR